MMDFLFDLDYPDIQQRIRDLGQASYRADQLWQGLYRSGWTQPEQFTNLPLQLREELSGRFIWSGLTEAKMLSSSDGLTRKYLYRLQDGKAIETVLMEYSRRLTACISSQVGCAMGCGFCATGNMGLVRNLRRGEIIEQVLRSAAIARDEGKELTNVVFMGMGEPFHNYDPVLSAIRILNDPDGFGMGLRRFTISTVGLVPGIQRFARERTQINLAISLHAAEDPLRSSLVPINRKYPISALMEACDVYLQATNRRITIEWAMIEGLNDGLGQAHKLAQLIAGKLYHVNLIQLNPVDHYPGQPAEGSQVERFRDTLQEAGIPCSIRVRRGIDIQAGCGQLASQDQT